MLVTTLCWVSYELEMRLSKKKKKNHLTQKYEVQYTGNMPSSESPDGKQPINRNLKLHNVSYQRSLSQTMSAFSCIPFILLTIDMSSSSVSRGEICQNRIAGIGLFNLSSSRPFSSWLCFGYLSPLNVS